MTRRSLSPGTNPIRRASDHLLGRCVCGPVWKCSAAPLDDPKKDTH